MLSSFDDVLEESGYHGDGQHADGHNYDCGSGPGSGHGSGGGMGGGMGGRMANCVDDGEFLEIGIDLENTGVLPGAKGDAEWEMNSERVKFSVEIEDIPVDSYALVVGGSEVGMINAIEMHDGDVYGRIKFMDPEAYGREHLDFDPRGQKVEVLQGGITILEVIFPTD